MQRIAVHQHRLPVVGELPIIKIVEFGLRVIAGHIDAGEAHERAGEEAAVALVHIIVGQDLRVELHWNLSEVFPVEGIFVGIVFRADLGAQPYRFGIVWHHDGIVLEG